MKLKNYFEDKKYVISGIFLKNISKLNLSLNEFLILVYLLNSDNREFDVKKVAESLSLKDQVALEAINGLIEKELISLSSKKNELGKMVDVIDLDSFYLHINDSDSSNNLETTKEDIFVIFEKEFGRTITAMEYELINAWLEKGFSEELILLALKEAIYNGVTNLRYIDAILFEWNRNGIKNAKDVEEHLKSRKSKNNSKKELFDYNWLDDEAE